MIDIGWIMETNVNIQLHIRHIQMSSLFLLISP